MGKILTDIAIRNLKPAAGRRIPAGNGLYVLVQPSGKTSYAVRYRFGGKPRKLTLPGGLSLKTARKAAGDALYEVEQGRDPILAKRETEKTRRKAAADTFEAIAEGYLERVCGMKRDPEGQATFSGKLRSGAWREGVLTRLVYPVLGDRPITEIKRSEFVELLDKIERVNGPVMADRTLAIVRAVMNDHAVRADDFRSPIVRGMARVKPKERARKRTLTDDELRAVWNAAESAKDLFGRLVQFLLLTMARRTEAARMPRSELANTDWILPGARNKAKVDLVRPLSKSAQNQLAKTPKVGDCQFVFSSDGVQPIGGFSKFKRKLDRDVIIRLRKLGEERRDQTMLAYVAKVEDLMARIAKAKGDAKKSLSRELNAIWWTLHDLRRTARSLMSRIGVPTDHAELCMGHVIGGVRETYDRYDYYDEKKRAYESLASQISRIVDPQENVVALRG